MELWLSAVLIVVIALVIDRVGELPNRYHLLRWIGNFVGFLDKRVKNRTSKWTKAKGFFSYMLVFFVFWFAIMVICSLVRNCLDGYQWEAVGITATLGEIVWIIVIAFMFKITFAVFSFRHHCAPIQNDLRMGDIRSAREKVQMIVSRDAGSLDEEHITSACCETISENLVDSAMSPAFYFGLFGMTGAVMFRCANLMDAMWGYLNDKYGNLGFFVAKFDDVLGFLTSRISPAFVALAAWIFGYDHKGVFKAAKEEHSKTPSPNSGWPMTAVACAMGISMEKKDVYVMGSGDLPSIDDVTRCYKLVERISMLFILTATLLFFVFIGIHIQVFIEDRIFDLLRMIV
ncbi:MAG: adenosylcobinamide-phosphate synthase CbiB [Methanomassiliicoccaceae archaeon]|nr:adenosylcobinamide-phosphate synthase CbiB [Methanomassiliicoccaceae archaeon]MCL2145598.1 adenosylcobinamide-phosphate synthase CbiB [Methanomassiliicoccaceae archaeon]